MDMFIVGGHMLGRGFIMAFYNGYAGQGGICFQWCWIKYVGEGWKCLVDKHLQPW
jgi:hypothetical protein